MESGFNAGADARLNDINYREGGRPAELESAMVPGRPQLI